MSAPPGALPSPPTALSTSTSPAGPARLVNLYHVRTVATAKFCWICHRETTCCLATEGVTDFIYACKSHLLDPGVSRRVYWEPHMPLRRLRALTAVGFSEGRLLTTQSLAQFAKPAPSTSTPSASPSGSPAPSPVPQSEIDKVKQEYEEKQKRKADADKEKDKDARSSSSTAGTAASTAFSLFRTGASALSSLSSTASSTLFPAPPPTPPSLAETQRAAAASAKTFVLQRDFFRMRQEQKRREWEKKDADKRGKEWSFPKAPTGGLPSAP